VTRSSPDFVLVPAVDRAARALDLLANAGSIGISDLARRLGVSKSVASNLLETLRAHGLVDRDGTTKLYTLGGQLVRLGHAASAARADLGPLARPHLVTLAEHTAEVALLVVARGTLATFIEKEEGKDARPRLSIPRGWRVPVHVGAHGKIFAVHGVLDADVEHPSLAESEVTLICEQGFALDDGEYMSGVRAAAAPVFDAGGDVIAAMQIVGLAVGLSMERLEASGRLVADCADQLSRAIGHAGRGHQGVAEPPVR
jgi:DNA-binding IclR family transcriptional regulator